MKLAFSIGVVALMGALFATNQDAPMFAPPVKEHEWLKQFVGEWEFEAETFMAPGQAPVKSTGTESTVAVGGYWILAQAKGTYQGMPLSTAFTVGYDSQKKKYIGTWVDSFTSFLWIYDGSVDESGKTLTLNTEGPSPITPGKNGKYRETTEFKGKDERVFTSSFLDEKDQWQKLMSITYKRKK